MTPRPHDPVVELRHRRARAPQSGAAELAAARRVATPARLAVTPVVASGSPPLAGARTTCGIIIIWLYTGIGMTLDATGGGCAVRPGLLRLALGLPVRRLRVRPGPLRLALGLPVRRLRARPGLLGHDDRLRLRLGCPHTGCGCTTTGCVTICGWTTTGWAAG